MKLQVIEKTHHTQICTSCAWSGGELYTCSDDKQILKWSQEGDMIAKIATVDAFVTSLAWAPDLGKAQKSNVFAASCTDGTVRFFSMSSPTLAREDKKVAAHTGAAVTVKWSPDASALMSAGEDGDLKIWSKSGNLRSTLAQSGSPVYAFVWGADGDTVLWSCGKSVNLKSQSGSGPRKASLSWAAHETAVTCVDWNRINDLIVTGGEDCVFKVWDAFGRQLFVSPLNAHVVTSVAWQPSGESFAVGSFNSLRLCDKTGWTHSRERPQVGSLLSLAWTVDGTELSGAGGNGGVVFAQLVERKAEWDNLEAVLTEPKLMVVTDASIEGYEHLEFPRDRVVEFALGWGHLVVATATQCFIYSVTNWNTPHIFDLRQTVQLIVLGESYFLMMDGTNVTVYSYEGRSVSNPRFQGLRPESLNKNTVSLCNDCVAILDRTDSKTIRMFDTATGKQLTGTVVHKTEVLFLALSKSSTATSGGGGSGGSGLADRRLAVVDRNRDLFLTPVVPLPGVSRGMCKLQTQVDTVAWSDTCDSLCCVADSRFLVWYYPNTLFVDRDLLSSSMDSKDASDLGKQAVVASFRGSRAGVRKADGALITIACSAYVPMLHAFVLGTGDAQGGAGLAGGLAAGGGGQWDEAVRLCRFAKEKCLWGCLAAMALQGRHLDTAEIALAALSEVDKLEFILHVKSIPSEEARNAELAVYRRCPDEAEAILLQAKPPLLYRAIKMNVRLFRWSRALEIALKHKKHVDTVLGYRARYLERFNKTETHTKFLQYAREVEVNWEAIKTKISMEKEDEKSRGGALTAGEGK